METRNQSNFVLVLACFGVVLYHLLGNEELYIGNAGVLNFKVLQSYYSSNGFFHTLFECLKGSTAIVGLFLINSGYGLYKNSKNQTPIQFYKKRFTKIWVYCLLCGILCTLVVFVTRAEFIYSHIFSLIPVFGFYEIPREGYVVQYWYLSLIFIYYLLFPYLRKVMNTKMFFYSVVFSAFIGYLVIFNIHTTTSIYHSTLCRLSEFCFGILLAKNQKIEKYFFEFKFIKIIFASIVIIIGYLMFFDTRFVPFSFLFLFYWSLFLGSSNCKFVYIECYCGKIVFRTKRRYYECLFTPSPGFPNCFKKLFEFYEFIFQNRKIISLQFRSNIVYNIFYSVRF